MARASALQAEGRRFDSDYLHRKASSLRRLEDKQAKESIRNAGTDKRNKKEYTKKSLILAQDER